MLETYAVGVKLDVAGNAQAALTRLIRDMEQFNRLSKDGVEAIGLLARDLRSLRGASRSISSLTTALEKLGNGKLGNGLAADMDKMAQATRNAVTAAEELQGILRTNARLVAEMAGGMASGSRRAASAGRGHGGFSRHDLLDVGLGAAMVGAPMVSFYAAAVRGGMDVGHLQTVLQADDRVSAAQAKGATDAAFAAARSVPGTTAAQNLGTILDLKQVTGSLSEAETAMPAFAKLQAVLEAMDRRKGGSGDPAFAAAKAMEILGRMTVPDPKHPGQHMIDAGELQRNVALLAQVAVGTNMRVDPQAYLAFAKQSRISGMALDDQALFRDFPALFMVQGGSRSGTGQMATYQQFINGQMTAVAANMLKAHHLLDKGAKWSHARVQDMPRHLVGSDVFQHNPVEWARRYLIPELVKEGITDPIKQAQTVSSFMSRQTGQGWMGEIVRNITGVDKESGNLAHTKADAFGLFQATDPTQAMRNFEAAWSTFLSSMGGPAMKDAVGLLNKATDGLNAMGAWARENPNMARVLVDTAGALGALAVGIGALSTAAFMFGPGLKLLGLGGGGAAAAAAAAGEGAGVAAGAGFLARLGLRGAGPVGLALGGAELMWSQMKPLTEDQAQKYAPWLGTPHDGYDAMGRPITSGAVMRPAGGQTVQVHTELNVDGRKVADAITTHQAGAAARPPSGPTQPSVRLGFPSPGLPPAGF